MIVKIHSFSAKGHRRETFCCPQHALHAGWAQRPHPRRHHSSTLRFLLTTEIYLWVRFRKLWSMIETIRYRPYPMGSKWWRSHPSQSWLLLVYSLVLAQGTRRESTLVQLIFWSTCISKAAQSGPDMALRHRLRTEVASSMPTHLENSRCTTCWVSKTTPLIQWTSLATCSATALT